MLVHNHYPYICRKIKKSLWKHQNSTKIIKSLALASHSATLPEIWCSKEVTFYGNIETMSQDIGREVTAWVQVNLFSGKGHKA